MKIIKKILMLFIDFSGLIISNMQQVWNSDSDSGLFLFISCQTGKNSSSLKKIKKILKMENRG